jgi:hypothetical protein
MELDQLDDQECMILVKGIELAIEADGRASASEAEALEGIVARVGQAKYDAAVARADDEIGDLDEFERRLESITRPEARDLIFGTVLELTLDASTGLAEKPVLTRMARAWNLQVDIPELASPELEPIDPSGAPEDDPN